MDILNNLILFVLNSLDSILPALGVPDSFFTQADSAALMFIQILQGASFFVPLDVLLSCFTVMIIADNFALIMRVVQFVIKVVRG